jgi:hypothetical protein
LAWALVGFILRPQICAAQQFDRYGGLTSVNCTAPAARFYTQKLGDRWWLCDPAGHGFFMKGVAYVMPNVDNQQIALNPIKYATGPTSVWELNWSLEQINRLRSWGFDTIADDSYAGLTPNAVDPRWGTSDNTIPAASRMPYTVINDTTRYILQNSSGCGTPSPIKDLINGVGSAYTGYHYNYADYFDPHFPSCVANIVKTSGIHDAATGVHGDYLLYITIDESDQTGGLLSSTGQDFSSLPAGCNGSGHPSWIVLATAPTQSSDASWNATYKDPVVYTKQAMSIWLVNRYHNDIRALDSAWGARYSTFGGNGGWGKGRGLLDEDGTCPSRQWTDRCWVGDQYTLAGETPTMRADMGAFYSYYLDRYLSVMRDAWHNRIYGAAGVLLQMQLGGWSTPPRKEALIEGARYLDLPQLASIPPPPWACPHSQCADAQRRVDFVGRYLGDHPWINWIGVDANPDSAESAYASGTDSPFSSQAARGAAYAGMMAIQLNTRIMATRTYPIVGFYWWSAFDMDSEKLNWGLMTPRDNPYDGRSARVAGIKDQWGYPTGGEERNYGDLISSIKASNFSADRILAASADSTDRKR